MNQFGELDEAKMDIVVSYTKAYLTIMEKQRRLKQCILMVCRIWCYRGSVKESPKSYSIAILDIDPSPHLTCIIL